MYRRIDGCSPAYCASRLAVIDKWKSNAFLTQPQVDLTDALQFDELAEHQSDSLLDALIRIFLDPITIGSQIPDGHRCEQLATFCFELDCFLTPLPQQREFKFTHRPLHPEQQSVVRMARIINAVFVDDQGTDQAAELEQSMPISPVARQALQSLLMDVVGGERLQKEVRDEQDHA